MSKNSKNKSTSKLEFIKPRMTSRIQRAREGRMARFVTALRVWLPALAVVVLLTLFVWPSFLPSFKLKDIAKNIPDLVIDNLHYSGVTNKNEPYSVSAKQATRPSSLNGIYDLTKPEGEITLQNGSWLDGKADFGRYDDVGKKLWLGGNVRLFHDQGYQVTTDEAQVDINTNEAWGNKSILIQGPFGTIQGVGFKVLDAGRQIIIQGPAKAILSLHNDAESGKSSLPESNK